MKKFLKIGYNLILVVLVFFLIAVAGTFLKIPGNYKLFTVMSGSMEPKVKLGSLIFVKPSANYQVGDIITIKAGKNTVTHRIAEISQGEQGVEYTTKGDANDDVDPEKTSAGNIVGKTFFQLPYVGYPIGYARTKAGFILLIIVPSVIIIYEEILNIKLEIIKKFAERKIKKEEPKPEEKIEDRIRIVEDASLVAPPVFERRRETSGAPHRRKIV